MVRTRRPLVERMTLVWHDWFATSNAGVGSQKLMLAQNRLLRRNALGRFDHLLVAITANPAMLLWLSGTDNRKGAPNENYGRELMELFTLGEGNGYTERDVREQARALTGWTSTWTRSKGQTNFRFDPTRHDPGDEDGVRQAGRLRLARLGLALRPPPEARRVLRRQALELLRSRAAGCEDARRPRRASTSDGFEVRPVLEAILRHPALYTGPRMVKSPVVYIAGLLRGLGRGIDTTAWVWLAEGAGQRLFYPPNVAGWDDSRWLDTNTFHGRWWIANTALEKVSLGDRRARRRRRCRTTPRRSSRARWPCSGTPRSGPRRGASCSRSPAAR